MTTGALAMVRCLELEGVKTAFGYPGAAICPFYDALAGSPIHHVLVRTEQNAAHAASGYARISGEVGCASPHPVPARPICSPASPRPIWTLSPWW